MNNARANRADRDEQCPLENQLIREMHGIHWDIFSILFSFINNSLCSNYACMYNDWCRGELTLFIANQSYASCRDRDLRVRVFEEFSARVQSRVIIVISLFTNRKRVVKWHIELFSLKSEKIRATRSDFRYT